MPPNNVAIVKHQTLTQTPGTASPAKILTNAPAGLWLVVATTNVSGTAGGGEGWRNINCSVWMGDRQQFLGEAIDESYQHGGSVIKRTLTSTSGFISPTGGTEVSMWCQSLGGHRIDRAQLMLIKVDGLQ